MLTLAQIKYDCPSHWLSGDIYSVNGVFFLVLGFLFLGLDMT